MENKYLKWVCGRNLEELIQNINADKDTKLKNKHLIINILGEHESDKKVIIDFQKQYIKLIETLKKENLNYMISIKPTQLGLCISNMYFYKIFDPIMQMLYENNIKVCIDMEDSKYYKDIMNLTKRYLIIYSSLRNNFENQENWLIRLAVQCDIKNSFNDIKDIIELGGTIRLCRGAYSKFDNYGIEKFETKEDIEENLKKCIEFVKSMNNDSSLASHSIKDEKLSMECLYGYVDNYDEYDSIYVPFGEKWLQYCKRRDPDNF